MPYYGSISVFAFWMGKPSNISSGQNLERMDVWTDSFPGTDDFLICAVLICQHARNERRGSTVVFQVLISVMLICSPPSPKVKWWNCTIAKPAFSGLLFQGEPICLELHGGPANKPV